MPTQVPHRNPFWKKLIALVVVETFLFTTLGISAIGGSASGGDLALATPYSTKTSSLLRPRQNARDGGSTTLPSLLGELRDPAELVPDVDLQQMAQDGGIGRIGQVLSIALLAGILFFPFIMPIGQSFASLPTDKTYIVTPPVATSSAPVDNTYVAPPPGVDTLRLEQPRQVIQETQETKQKIVTYFRDLANELEKEEPARKETLKFLIDVFESSPLLESMGLKGLVTMIVNLEEDERGDLSIISVGINPMVFEASMEDAKKDPRFNGVAKSTLIKETGSIEEGVLTREYAHERGKKLEQYHQDRSKVPEDAMIDDSKLIRLAREILSNWVGSEYTGFSRKYEYLLKNGLGPKALEELATQTESPILKQILQGLSQSLRRVVKDGKIDERRLKIDIAMTFYYAMFEGYFPDRAQLVKDVFRVEARKGNVTSDQVIMYWQGKIDSGALNSDFLSFLTDPSYDWIPRDEGADSVKDGGTRSPGKFLFTPAPVIVPLMMPQVVPLVKIAATAKDGGEKALAVQQAEQIREALIQHPKVKTEKRYEELLDFTNLSEVLLQLDKELQTNPPLHSLAKVILRTFTRLENARRASKGEDPVVPYSQDLFQGMIHSDQWLDEGKAIMMSPSLIEKLDLKEAGAFFSDPISKDVHFLPTKDGRLEKRLKDYIVHPRDVIKTLAANKFVFFVDAEDYASYSENDPGSIYGPKDQELARFTYIKVTQPDPYAMLKIAQSLFSEKIALDPKALDTADKFLLQTLTDTIQDFPALPGLTRELNFITPILIDILQSQV